MAYDDPKVWEGQRYSGMRVGGHHSWDYPDGRWEETKVAPDQWDFRFRSTKRRRRAAPEGSGAEPGTMFHWFVMAHQRVRKVDADTYDTLMEGAKWKVAHKKPAWRKWSSEYDPHDPARERVAQILEDAARALRGEGPARAPRLENLLDPAVLQTAARTLDSFADEEA